MTIPDMPDLDKTFLFKFLREIEERLNRNLVLVAVGGTAMTLLNLKLSTIDVDFTGTKSDIDELRSIAVTIPHGINLDTWPNGDVYSQTLPDDYLEKSLLIDSSAYLTKIELRALHPIDIVVTKLGRLNQRDIQDIVACITSYQLDVQAIRIRGKYVASMYPGNEREYESRLEQIITTIDKIK